MNTFVNLVIIGLAIYALITAIRAVKQVQKQRQVNADYQPKQNESVDVSQDVSKGAAAGSQSELQEPINEPINEPISTDSEPTPAEPTFSEMTGTVDASVWGSATIRVKMGHLQRKSINAYQVC